MILSPDEQRRLIAPPVGVDAICDAFEAAWFAGHEPRIEEFLGRGNPVHRDELLRELLLAEWDLRRRNGQHPELETYHARFPEDRQALSDLWRLWTERQAHSMPGGFAVELDMTRNGAVVEEPSALIDRYKLLEKLGEGGFGSV